MSPTTTFLGRLIGLFLLLVGLSMMMQEQAAVEIWIALVRSLPLLYAIGLITVAAGLAIVIRHNVWSGGMFPITITVLGWVTLLKGLLTLFAPSALGPQLIDSLHFEQFFYVYVAVWLVLGVYLTYEGFRTEARR